MNVRPLGRSGYKVSEVGFGAWAIGGASYGRVDKAESLRALAKAEELGCNFVDTAAVYGDSEAVLGEFLQDGRREHWIVATKYSGQKEGIRACLERQLQNLRTDRVDLYQMHWAAREESVYQTLAELKQEGLVRALGVSLYNTNDIDFVLARPEIDCFQIPFSLLAPEPYLSRIAQITAAGVGVIVRSCLKEGFLSGKYSAHTTFDDPRDQRHTWSRRKIVQLAKQVDRFRFLEQDTGSLLLGAARYPLAFSCTSTVIMGTKTTEQAVTNFAQVPAAMLESTTLDTIRSTQKALGLTADSSILARIARYVRGER